MRVGLAQRSKDLEERIRGHMERLYVLEQHQAAVALSSEADYQPVMEKFKMVSYLEPVWSQLIREADPPCLRH